LPFHTFQVIHIHVNGQLAVNGYGSPDYRVFELAVACTVLPVQIPSLRNKDGYNLADLEYSFHTAIILSKAQR
jgi:hypothetical protein